MDFEEDEDKVVETDPSGRFERYNKSMGKGAYKDVFKAYDQDEGVEVAWNSIRVNQLTIENLNRIFREIQILQSLRNENIINLLYSWRVKGTKEKDNLYFITELMSSGSLKSYIGKTKGQIKPKIIRNWCRQILNGLNYLHTRPNPIIHRDLKCENIFVSGNNGQAKIGDLGLAVVKMTQHLSSVLGTPEFMAPELYDENYDEKVDIYAFGMVVLEISTKAYPYSECTNQAQIYKKVTTGIKPAALSQVVDTEVRELIELCIEFDPTKRPSAQDLLDHPFFTSIKGAYTSNTDLINGSGDIESPFLSPIFVAVEDTKDTHHAFEISTTPQPKQRESLESCQVEVEALTEETNIDEVTLKMTYHTGESSTEIRFPFGLKNDTATDVVSELVREKLVRKKDEEIMRRRIEETIRRVLTDTKKERYSTSVLGSEKSDDGLDERPRAMSAGLDKFNPWEKVTLKTSFDNLSHTHSTDDKLSSSPINSLHSVDIPLKRACSPLEIPKEAILSWDSSLELASSKDPLHPTEIARRYDVAQKLTDLQNFNLQVFDLQSVRKKSNSPLLVAEESSDKLQKPLIPLNSSPKKYCKPPNL